MPFHSRLGYSRIDAALLAGVQGGSGVGRVAKSRAKAKSAIAYRSWIGHTHVMKLSME